MLTFLVFLIFILNPKIEKKHAEYHKDLVIVVSDMTQSIVETKKATEVLSIHKDLSDQLTKISNIEQINIRLNNNKEIDKYTEEEIQTSLFKEVNNVIKVDRSIIRYLIVKYKKLDLESEFFKNK